MPVLTVTLTDEQMEDLRQVSKASGVPIAEIVRRAIWSEDGYLGSPKHGVGPGSRSEVPVARRKGVVEREDSPEARMARVAPLNAFSGQRGGAVPKVKK